MGLLRSSGDVWARKTSRQHLRKDQLHDRALEVCCCQQSLQFTESSCHGGLSVMMRLILAIEGAVRGCVSDPHIGRPHHGRYKNGKYFDDRLLASPSPVLPASSHPNDLLWFPNFAAASMGHNAHQLT